MDYLRIIKNPKHGYGKNLNPCIDCRIYILKKAKNYARKIDAKFIFTGEVLGQRPMSQHRQALKLIEKEAGLKNKILRPLSAKYLPETEAEKNCWVNREKLLAITGKGRSPQINLAKKYQIEGIMCGGKGCRLTDREFCIKLKDLFKNKKRISMKDISLLKCGKHFRFENNKIIVGRNKEDNNFLLKNKGLLFETKDIAGPVTLLLGKPNKKSIEIAAKLTARYSDSNREKVLINYGKKQILVEKFKDQEIEEFRLKKPTPKN